jgi:hypothetical protein
MKSLFFIVSMVYFLSFISLVWASEEDPFKPKIPQPEVIEYQPEEIRIAEPDIDITPIENLVVQGVFWGGRFPQAIINGEVYKVDDIINGVDARLLSIEKDKIKILFLGRVFSLTPKKKALNIK